MKRSLLILITIAGIFACGGVAGWFLRPVIAPEPVAHVTVEKRLPTPSKTIASLDERLHFTDAQKAALQPIIEEWARTARAAEMPMREKRYEAFQTAAPRIRELLTPEQQKKYDRITENARAEWERRTKTGSE
jgi:hypothetical protein